jgi:hypothetical protein
LPSSFGIGKPGPSPWGLPGSKVGDDSAFRTRSVDFAFIQTRLSYDIRLNAWISEAFMLALDQAAATVPRFDAEC